METWKPPAVGRQAPQGKEGGAARSLSHFSYFLLNHHHLESLLPLPLHILPHYLIRPQFRAFVHIKHQEQV